MAITAPSNLSATPASASQINLSWTNPQSYDDIAVHRSPNGSSWSQVATLPGTATSYPDTSCQDGTIYYYKLEVSKEMLPNPPETAYSNTTSATTPLPAPSGLSGSSEEGGTEADLTWSDNSQNESGFKVYKNGSLLATLGANATSYTATGLTPGANYSFYVKAYNALVTSSASNTLNLLMANPPAAPSGLAAQATGTAKAQLNWTDNSNNEIDFRIERSATSPTTGFSEIATVSANVKTYEDASGLASNTQYWWRVRARNASGYSTYCTVATATTWAAIAQPTNLVAVAVSGTEIDLYFQDNSEEESYHSLERKTGAGGEWAEIAQLAPNRNCYRDTGLTKNTTYYYRVRAVQE